MNARDIPLEFSVAMFLYYPSVTVIFNTSYNHNVKILSTIFLDLHLWVFRASNQKTFLQVALGCAHTVLWMAGARRNQKVCTGSLLKEKVLANTTWVASACSTPLSSDRHAVFPILSIWHKTPQLWPSKKQPHCLWRTDLGWTPAAHQAAPSLPSSARQWRGTITTGTWVKIKTER